MGNLKKGGADVSTDIIERKKDFQYQLMILINGKSDGLRKSIEERVYIKELNYMDYYKYIHSPEWFTRTELIRKRNNGLCECCVMRYGTCVHHRTYERLGEELDSDLLHVCIYCHRMIHKKGKYFIWESRLDFLTQLQGEVDGNRR